MKYCPPAEFLPAVTALGVQLSADQIDRLTEFVKLLLQANERFNLTTIRSPREAWTRHVLDSLSLVPHLSLDAGASVVDVGAGGGLPGLVLAIARPDLRFTLIDATGKKVRHIGQVAQALQLDHVTAVHGRAEDLACSGGQHRERHDMAVARALAPLPVLLELVIPFLKVGARFVAIKGQKASEELQAAARAMSVLNTTLQAQHRTPTGTVLCLRKSGQTAKQYPRRSGEPKRLPIGG